MAIDYPWYSSIRGENLEQGDVLTRCPVFLPPSNLPGFVFGESSEAEENVEFSWERRNVIVLSQTCDLAQGKLSEVLLCLLWERSELPAVGGAFSGNKGLEQARRGHFPGFHMLGSCDLKGLDHDIRVADFRRLFSLPLPFLKQFADKSGDRCRLLPPYREHLSQSFARFFMRVGLPVDIPKFA